MRKRIFATVVLLVFFLSPIMVHALDIDVTLGIGQFYVVHRNASNNWRITGTFAAENTIKFAICDSDNYNKWLNNQTPSLYEDYESTSYSFNFTVPYDDDWYVIFSNTDPLATNTLNAEVYYINQDGTIQTEITALIQSSIITPFFVGFLVLISALCLLGIWCARHRERQHAVRYEELLSVPE